MAASSKRLRDPKTNLVYSYGCNEKCEWYERSSPDGYIETVTRFYDNNGYDIFARNVLTSECFYTAYYDAIQLRSLFRYMALRYRDLIGEQNKA